MAIAVSLSALVLTSTRAEQPQISWMLGGHVHFAQSVAFSPDGQVIASGNASEGTIKIWRAADGELLRTLSRGGTQIVFSPDGATLLSPGAGDVVLQRVSDGELLETYFAGEGHADAVFSPDGQLVATGGSDASVEEVVRIWTVDGTLLHEPKAPSGSHVGAVRFTPDGQVLLTAMTFEPGNVRRWDVQSGALLNEIPGHSGGIAAFDLAPSGQIMAAGGSDGLIHLRDALTGALLQTLDAEAGKVHALEFSPDGQKLASSHAEDRVAIWNLISGGSPVEATAFARDISWSPDGQRLVLAGVSLDAVEVIDAGDGSHIASFADYEETLDHLGVSLGGPGLMVNSDFSGKVQVRSSLDGTLISEFPLATTFELVMGVGLSADATQVMIADSTNTCRVLDVASGAEVAAFALTPSLFLRPIVFSSDGTLLADALFDQPLTIRSVPDGQTVATLPAVGGPAAFSADNTRVAAGGFGFLGHSARIWQIPSGAVVQTFDVDATVLAIAYSPDGQHVAIGDMQARVTLWRVADGALLHTLLGHTGQISALAFSTDGQVLASANRLGLPEIRLWRVADGMSEAVYDRDVGAGASGLVSTPDGGHFIASRFDAALMAFGNPLATIPADLNGDGDVDGFDLALLLGAWGRCPAEGECAADLDGNGAVNGFDLGILLAAWGRS